MILDKYVRIKINPSNYKRLKSLGYIFNNVGDEIIIKVEDLSENSHVIVEVECDICNNIKNIQYRNYIKNIKKYNIFTCCNKCAMVKNKKTNLEKYKCEHHSQNENVKNKKNETNLKKYNNFNPLLNPTINKKRKQTMLEKYDSEFSMSSDVLYNKIKQTMLEKYDSEFSMSSDVLYNKIKQTMLKKYGVEIPINNKIIKENIKNTRIKNIINNNNNILDINNSDYYCFCVSCNSEYIINSNLYYHRNKLNTIVCTKCNPINSFTTSGKEKFLLEFIKENYDGEILENSRNIIKPYELDIYLPDLNLAFEFNGLYWHNEINKKNDYHKIKSDSCLEKGIQLIHVWEDDWNYKQDIVKSMILNKLGKTPTKIYARKCIIKEINDNKLVNNFLIKNHLQGFVGSSVKLGLFYNNEMVSLMTFGKKRKFMNSSSKEGEYELLRFCNKLNTNVIGGASKLFNHFKKNYKYTEITTYADRSYSQGNLYKMMDFNFIYNTEPNYYYVIDGIRKHRFGFRKDVLVKEGYDTNKSEHEIMLERKIYRIYNSGNSKYNVIKNA